MAMGGKDRCADVHEALHGAQGASGHALFCRGSHGQAFRGVNTFLEDGQASVLALRTSLELANTGTAQKPAESA